MLLLRWAIAHSVVTNLHIHIVHLRWYLRLLLLLLLDMNTVTWLLFAHILSSKVTMISHQMLAWRICWMMMMMTWWRSLISLSCTTWMVVFFLRSLLRFLLLLSSSSRRSWWALGHMVVCWNITRLFLVLLLKLITWCVCHCVAIAWW